MPSVVLDFLGIFRLTRLATVDTFPPVRKARYAVLQRWSEDSWQVDLLTCQWCLSAWIAAAVLVVRDTRAWRALSYVLAASAVTGILAERT